jgi:hypothetical protein
MLKISIVRGSFIAIGELATYDHSKHILKTYVVSEKERHLVREVELGARLGLAG